MSLALILIAASVAWLVGGLALRAIGWLLLVVGLIVALGVGSGPPLALCGAGGALWIAGHWHYALRHRSWRSALARAVVSWLPVVRDPAEGWDA